MNPEYEKRLAAQIQRELDTLSELPAPPALAGRVLRAIEQRAVAPWYHRAWQTWPLPLRATSFTGLVALFGGICFGVFQVSQGATASATWQQVGEWFAWVDVAWRTAGVLADALGTAIRHAGTSPMIACVLVLTLAYAACIGVGTVYLRLAWARK